MSVSGFASGTKHRLLILLAATIWDGLEPGHVQHGLTDHQIVATSENKDEVADFV